MGRARGRVRGRAPPHRVETAGPPLGLEADLLTVRVRVRVRVRVIE